MLPHLALLLACTSEAPPRPHLAINEVMAGNDGAVLDATDPVCPEADDWVELVNTGDAPAALGGLTLSDDDGVFALPDRTLAPGGHLLIWADDQPTQGPLHAPFRIDADGAHLELRLGDVVLDAVDVPPIDRDHSWARVTDGGSPWVELTTPTPEAPNQRVLSDDPCFRPTPGFEDHAWPCLTDDASYDLLAAGGKVVKFVIFAFDAPTTRRVVFMDSAFYTLHDQYYLFHAFNGEPFEGLDGYPPFDGAFATWGEIERWAAAVDLEALIPSQQARFAGPRLWSPYFYSAVNGDDRIVGVGTLQHIPAAGDRGEVWAFDLEFADAIDHDALVVYFETLEAHGPPAFADLHWLIRSPDHEALAATMAADGLAYADRVLRYEDLTAPGEVEVYHPGLTAGRVRILDPADPLSDARADDILVLQALPDELPPCAALITTVPQTELSHVALLAESRGIPNLYVEGLADDPLWVTWNRRPTWVAVEASDDGGFCAAALDDATYQAWLDGRSDQPTVPSAVDPTSLPWSVPLDATSDMLALRPQAGGKVAGMAQLLATPGVDTPDTPLAITVRGYHAHLDANAPWLEALLDAPPFDATGDARLRYLVLEGREAYDARYRTATDAVAADAFLADAAGSQAALLALGQGLFGHLATAPVPPEADAGLRAALEDRFGWLDPAQGVRFRSSSTVEDLEGFNGAGLYLSASGALQPEGDDTDVLDAVREVWASYWGAEAYEERRAAGIDALAGGMGVLVHPRFDDAYELANGVLTAQRQPDGSLEVLVNGQHGATSVVSPPDRCPPVRPERVRMSDAGGVLEIERFGASSLIPADSVVLDDDQLLALFGQASDVVDGWLATENGPLDPARHRSVLTLDLEWREMAAGWPDGTSTSPRLVLKQARSLDPGIGGLPDDIQALPAPVDVLARAQRVEIRVCEAEGLEMSAVGVTTDPLAGPDLGYGDVPFVVAIDAQVTGEPVAPIWPEGTSWAWDHLVLDDVVWSHEIVVAALPTGEVAAAPEGRLALEDGYWEGSMQCRTELWWTTPDRWLLDALDAPK